MSPLSPLTCFVRKSCKILDGRSQISKDPLWTSQNLTRIGRCHLGSCEMSDPRRWQPTEEVSGVSQWLSLGTTDPWWLDFGEASLVWWGGPSKDPQWFPNPNVCPIKTERSLVLSSSPSARFNSFFLVIQIIFSILNNWENPPCKSLGDSIQTMNEGVPSLLSHPLKVSTAPSVPRQRLAWRLSAINPTRRIVCIFLSETPNFYFFSPPLIEEKWFERRRGTKNKQTTK